MGLTDAEGKEFEITIEANRKYVLRQTLSPVRGNAPEPDRRNLLTAMFAAAVIGGLLLNFMPCVFPVLSLKLLSLTKFGARNVSSVRRSFAFTLLGIWLYRLGADYAYAQRGYFAGGGEVLALLLPYFYWAVSRTVKDFVADVKRR